MTDRVRFVTSDGVGLSGRWHRTPGAPACAVLVHGFTGHAADANVVRTAEALVAEGVEVLTYDARGHGGSGGLCTLGDHERHDVSAAVAMARHDHDRVVVVGASMGAIAVLGHAAHDTGLAGVVTVSAPSRWVLPLRPQAVLAAILTRTPPGRFLVSAALRVRVDPRRGDPAAPVELAGRVTAPYAVVHGTRDRFIPVACAHDLHAAAPASTLHLVEDLGHAYQPAGVETIVTAVRTMAQAPAAVAAPA